jgi:hypothetical protein
MSAKGIGLENAKKVRPSSALWSAQVRWRLRSGTAHQHEGSSDRTHPVGLLSCRFCVLHQTAKEVVAFVIHQNEGWKIFNLDLPNGFHTQFWIINALDFFDVLLGQQGGRAAD